MLAPLLRVDDVSFILHCVLQDAGKADALSDPDGALTILAPNDAAFAKIPEEDLRGLLANPMALMAVRPPQHLSMI